MKKLITIAFALLLLPLSAQDEQKPSPAERLLNVIEFQKTIVEGGEAGFGMVEQSLANQNLTKAEMAEVKEAFMDYMGRLANDPELLSKTIELYNASFTEDEINELIAFYRTPLGKKTLTTLPDIMGETMKLSTALAQKHVGPFQETLGKVLERKAAREQDKEGE
ncbi:DUF2059 domain-containing protein [Verrucomicrobiaceae bacterium 227]